VHWRERWQRSVCLKPEGSGFVTIQHGGGTGEIIELQGNASVQKGEW
jgi:hypothetical protein